MPPDLLADIKKAFLGIREEGRDAFRFLFNSNGKEEHFRFAKIPFSAIAHEVGFVYVMCEASAQILTGNSTNPKSRIRCKRVGVLVQGAGSRVQGPGSRVQGH